MSCKDAVDIFNANFPGGTDATVIDNLTWNTFFRPGKIHLIIPSHIREMSGAQRRTLVIWLLQQIQSRLPVGWARTAALSTKINEVIDCLNAPTAAKRAALQAFASALVVDFTDPRDEWIANTMKGLCNLVANQISDYYDVIHLVRRLIKIALVISGADLNTVYGAVLTKLEQIIGIRD